MSISTGVPENWVLPLFWASVDGSQAGGTQEGQPAVLFGQAFLGGEASVAPKGGGNTGNGVLTLDTATPVLVGAVAGIYKAKFTTATAYTVTDPNNVSIGSGTLGTAWVSQIKFNIVAGSTPFIANDEFDITVTALPLGSAQYNVPVPVGGRELGKAMFGDGSMLSQMIQRFFDGNTTQQLWAVPVPRPSAGTKAVGSIKVATPATASGVWYEYIAGQLVQVTVYSTDTANAVATNFAAAVNTIPSLPVTAAVDGTDATKVNLTARWHGLTGNDITFVTNYLGINGGQALPAGMSLTKVPMSGGTGTPDFTAAISAIQAIQLYNFALPYVDTASMAVFDAEVGFGPTGRWNYTRQQYGWVYSAYRGDYATTLTWGIAQNSPVISTMAVEVASPSPVWEWTAAYCAQGAAALLDDSARPLQTLELPGILPAPVGQRYSQPQLNILSTNGLAIQAVAPSGNPSIRRESTQYQRNAYGQSDTAFSKLTTLSNLAELLTRFKSAITTKYPRHKLAPDGTRYGPGQAIVTPSVIKAEIASEASQAEYDGLMAQVPEFLKALIVELDPNNPDRVNVLWPPRLMGQLRTFAVLAQYRLMYPTTTL